ncbi:TetR/AcrR family transcriptional regulator [Bacillus horti]|uniref:AcrR family transcriptional regulator n=1 Tax=Caldalkalibacillus horti TaxID=77523 RepID=A0ABT9W396_9BACI|nr:TetR/AcrR family transcriptional regulator [Bacillus horti]MDQ0167728.1 AcrR family transcriptional regulator [Bacillus horti]
MSSKTKDKIIQTAVKLFNESGTGAISTNHIAKELGISPGNLYYHFQNKEEIIRAIFESMISDWDSLWLLPPADWLPSLDDLIAVIRLSLRLEWKYRFFYRELILLIKHDTKLKEAHQHIQQQRMVEQKEFFQAFINAGILSLPESSKDVDSLLTSCWIISNYWLSFVEVSGAHIDENRIEQGIQLILSVLRPYLASSN